ncbi:unnamed protein product [Auanema sp. JU1783]|nr:unnamed protein product [Auanema sp. JU1783]
MSQGGVPNIPPPTFPTFVSVVDPPRPLPHFSNRPAEEERPVQAHENVRVPYHHPSSSQTAPAVTSPPPTVSSPPVQGATATQPVVTKKLPLAPQGSKTYNSKRTFKVIIVGDAGVGKTCLSFRFCCGRFPEHTEATIGVDFRERSCVIEKELLKVQLWDTAGQERYRQSIVAHYYRNVNAVVFVYDVNTKNSFDNLKGWIQECEKHGLTANADVPRILIGNKCDLATTEKVSTDVAQIFADRNNMALFETSAKADSETDHVESIFLTLLHKLQQSKPMHVQSQDEREATQNDKLVLKATERAALEDDGWCC